MTDDQSQGQSRGQDIDWLRVLEESRRFVEKHKGATHFRQRNRRQRDAAIDVLAPDGECPLCGRLVKSDKSWVTFSLEMTLAVVVSKRLDALLATLKERCVTSGRVMICRRCNYDPDVRELKVAIADAKALAELAARRAEDERDAKRPPSLRRLRPQDLPLDDLDDRIAG